jgi:hypothetical protein
MSIKDKRTKTASAKGKSIRSRKAMQTIGDWLFRGNKVYMLAAPNRMLTTRRINWDRETSDVQDEDGNVFYDVSWHEIEFWNPEDYHLPEDD